MISQIHLIKDIKECNILHLCFDNDRAGDEFCEIIKNSNIKENNMIIRIKPKFKDFNEDLMNLKIQTN
jgi:outer membrane lipopolysaccharide assembly protein LptE/RlpB